MKRLSIIFNVALLSLLIIMVSGGVTLMHCNHTGSLSVVQLSVNTVVPHGTNDTEDGEACGMGADCQCNHSHGLTIGELPCMNYTLLSCQPSIYCHGYGFSPTPVCVQLPDFMETVVKSDWRIVSRQWQTECSGRHGPPRDYLRLMTVLQI